MFVGHYSASFAARRVDRRIPLWFLFVAVQFVDFLWAIFVLLGVERVRIVPGITATNPLDLYYMPYTHSLLGSLAWSVLLAAGYRLWKGERAGTRGPWVVGAAVFSHWILDFLVHRPDLALWDDTLKVGLGLWNYPVVALILEVGLLVAGLIYYLRGTEARGAAGRYGFPALVVVMVAVHLVSFFGTPPTSPAVAAWMALGAYVVLAALAGWLERYRVPAGG